MEDCETVDVSITNSDSSENEEIKEAAEKEISKLAAVVAAYKSLMREMTEIDEEHSALLELKSDYERKMGELENMIHGEPSGYETAAAAEEKSALLKKDITSVKDDLGKLARKNLDREKKLSSLSKVMRQLPLPKNTQRSKGIQEDKEKFLERAPRDAENNIPFPVARAVSAGVAALAVAALAVWYVRSHRKR